MTSPTLEAQVEQMLPCPFCGADAEIDCHQPYRNISTARVETSIAIYCPKCGAQQAICRGDVPSIEPENVIALWNARSADQFATIAALQADVARLTEALEPFARDIKHWSASGTVEIFVTIGQLRKARAALMGEK